MSRPWIIYKNLLIYSLLFNIFPVKRHDYDLSQDINLSLQIKYNLILNKDSRDYRYV